MLTLRLHYNLAAYTPVVEFYVHPDVVKATLNELHLELSEGALHSVEVETPDGLYRLKRRN